MGEAVLAMPDVVEHVLKGLAADELARAACVRKSWQDIVSRLAKPMPLMIPYLQEEKLALYDFENEKVYSLVLKKFKDLRYDGRVWSTEGFLVMCLNQRYLVICDPCKNRWSEPFEVPAKYTTLLSESIVTFWRSDNPLLLLSDEKGHVIIYNFETETWKLGEDPLLPPTSTSINPRPVSFLSTTVVRVGNALETHFFDGGWLVYLLRLYPDAGETSWKVAKTARGALGGYISTAVMDGESVVLCTSFLRKLRNMTYRESIFKFEDGKLVKSPLFVNEIRPKLDDGFYTFESLSGMVFITKNCSSKKVLLFYIPEMKWMEMQRPSLKINRPGWARPKSPACEIYVPGCASTKSTVWSRYLSKPTSRKRKVIGDSIVRSKMQRSGDAFTC